MGRRNRVVGEGREWKREGGVRGLRNEGEERDSCLTHIRHRIHT